MSVFFNTEIKSGSFLEDFGNFCLLPVGVLFDRKTYIQVDKVFLSNESDVKTHIIAKIIKVALALLFIAPGLILGTLFKSMSYIHSSVRDASNDFKNAVIKKEFDRVFIEESTSRVHLHGDPKEFDPSVLSFQRGIPYEWLEENVSTPKKMDLRGIEPHVVERLFKTNIDFNSLNELDIRDTRVVDAMIVKIVEKCPNLRIFKADPVGPETLDFIISHCQTLDKNSKIALSLVDFGDKR